jgi:hypothetical protein
MLVLMSQATGREVVKFGKRCEADIVGSNVTAGWRAESRCPACRYETADPNEWPRSTRGLHRFETDFGDRALRLGLRLLDDDRHEFALVVQHRRVVRHEDRVVRSGEAGDPLVEECRQYAIQMRYEALLTDPHIRELQWNNRLLMSPKILRSPCRRLRSTLQRTTQMYGPPFSNLAQPSTRRGHLMDGPRGLSISHLRSEPTRTVPSIRTLVEDWLKVSRLPNWSMSHCWQ